MIVIDDSNLFDQSPVGDATLDDIDVQGAERHLEYATRTNRYAGETRDVLQFLIEQRAAVKQGSKIIPTIAGMLMFGRWPQRFLPHIVA